MVGRTLSHYSIVEEIGKGGMGVVYKARDNHLDKDVAIKVLTPGTLTDELARKRFRREAVSLAKLIHPNITTVHDFDTQDGIDFLVMEYIPGAMLSDKVAAGPLPEAEVIRLGIQLAQGMSAAHQQGLVHRDLKPGNLRVTPDNRLKVLDFGLAKLLRPLAETDVNTSRTVVAPEDAGTLPYMSPEQLRGETTDARADIFAMGAVLYEMATGKRPFPETHPTRLIDSILNQSPEPPSKIHQSVSAGLDRTIMKALEKNPVRRYQSAQELLADLEQVNLSPSALRTDLRRRRPSASGRIKSVAVLPLENLSGDPGEDYFADGMTDALISSLAKIGALRVISRTSVMVYKGARKPLPAIAGELNVDAIVEGSVLRAAERVRVTAQLVHAATDQHLWSESYERDMTDVLGLQSDVARAIAESIQLKLSPKQKAGLKKKTAPLSPAAYEAYLKGRYHWNKRSGDGLERAIHYFQEAIGQDSKHAPAYAGLADTFALLGTVPYDAMPPREVMPKAKDAAVKALLVDETLAEAHASLAYILMSYDWDFEDAEKEFKRAFALNPGYATAHQWYALFLTVMGRTEEAISEIRIAQSFDPLSVVINTTAALVYNFARRFDQAIEQCQKVFDVYPGFPLAHFERGRAYEQKGMFEEALAEHRTARTISGDTAQTVTAVGHALALLARREEALKVVEDLLEMGKRKYIPAIYLAGIFAALNDVDQAMQWLEKAFKDRSDYLVYLRREPTFDNLHPDPRFQDLLRRIGLPS
ncbi:MAG TPA: protein kinase [Terriglobia bacterium]|nr:protein kinase [Terriglobia bacterium]